MSVTTKQARRRVNRASHRAGKVLVFFVALLPALIGVLGVMLDGSIMIAADRDLQGLADAAATVAAKEYQLTGSVQDAIDRATEFVQVHNGLATANVAVNIPPTTGDYAGQADYAEVTVSNITRTNLIHAIGISPDQTQAARAVAGVEDATAGAAIVVLDPRPSALSVEQVPPMLLSPPSMIAGLEVTGVGRLRIDGAVHVNTEWGSVDESGFACGENAGPPYGISCMPLLPLTTLSARDIRTVGGVDNQNYYGHYQPGESSPLRSGRLPVPDPFAGVPVPTIAADPNNVSSTEYGGVDVVGIPLIGPVTTLSPGVYEWINIVSGRVVFEPGVYIIRSTHPITQLSLNMTAGEVTAEGVMFYITNESGFSPSSGVPDSMDGELQDLAATVDPVQPSVVLDAGLLNSSFSPLNDLASPYHGMFIFQRRQDPRMIVLAYLGLLGGDELEGAVYSKWGHIAMVGQGTIETTLVGGTVRFVTVGDTVVRPANLLPPARDVFLVE